MINNKEILKRIVNGGSASDYEIKAIYKNIKNNEGDLYSNLLTLGRAMATEYVDLVESYLVCKNDPMISKLSLQILCHYWGLTSHYKNHIVKFMRGVDWDIDEDVKIMAINCAEYFLRDNKDMIFLKELYFVFKNDEDEINRAAAYKGLAAACGVDMRNFPSPYKFDLLKDVDLDIVNSVEMQLQASL